METFWYIIKNFWGVILLVLVFLFNLGYTGRDDTDSTASRKRSNMSLLTDYGTGCQYLKGGLIVGSLTPRLDKNGKHICK